MSNRVKDVGTCSPRTPALELKRIEASCLVSPLHKIVKVGGEPYSKSKLFIVDNAVKEKLLL